MDLMQFLSYHSMTPPDRLSRIQNYHHGSASLHLFDVVKILGVGLLGGAGFLRGRRDPIWSWTSESVGRISLAIHSSMLLVPLTGAPVGCIRNRKA